MTHNTLAKSAGSLSREAIADIENSLGMALPAGLAELYLSHNGGIPEKAYWPLDSGEFLWVKRFLSMKIPSDTARTLEETRQLGLDKDFLPPDLVPFAIDHGGNYFCFDAAGRIYFYALDAWRETLSAAQNKAKAKQFLCADFVEFFNGLALEGE